MKIKRLFILIVLMISAATIRAQSPAKWIKYGDQSIIEKDYYGASKYFKTALDLDSANLEVIDKYAGALRLFNDYIFAEKYYAYLNKLDRNKSYKETSFWLAAMQKNNGKYQEARKNFTRFSVSCKDKKSFIYLKSIQEIASCEYAQSLMNDTVPVKVMNLGLPVNTVNADFAALQPDDSTLIFSSLRKEEVVVEKKRANDDYIVQIFSLQKSTNGTWGKDSIDIKVSSKKAQNANGTYSLDKSRFYFSRCPVDQDCKIWVTYAKTGQDTTLALSAPINQEGYSSTQPNVGEINGEEILFFVSNFPGGVGKLDIWQSKIDSAGFGKLVNLGPSINSIDDELTPFFDATSRSLYFASSWHLGLGGFDIFKSVQAASGWQAPENLGYPINSSANDFYYSHYLPNGTSYLTSNRIGSLTSKSATCCNDIWQYTDLTLVPKIDSLETLPPDKDFLALKESGLVKLYFHNDEPMPRSQDSSTSLNYEQTYQDYQKLFVDYQQNYTQGLDGAVKDSAAETINQLFDEINLGMLHLEKFASQLLKNLESGKRLELTVKGFASPLAKTDYNVRLTLRRIASMENYLKLYREGALIPYFTDSATNGGFLRIIKIPFGEYKSQTHVIDDLGDTRQSVYSPDAARERRIEIVEITQSHKDSAYAQIQFDKEIYDFGNVKPNEVLAYSFSFINTGNIPLQLTDTNHPYSFVKSKIITETVLPNKNGILDVEINTQDLRGKQTVHLQVHTNAKVLPKELTLTFEIVD